MTKIILSGCNGQMGRAVTALCAERENITISAGFDTDPRKLSSYPVYAHPMEFGGNADVLIDFSSPSSLEDLLKYCGDNNIPCVLCTTGYSDADLKMINDYSKSHPVFRSGNMSLGINLLTALVKKAAEVLGENYDVEIVERHHRKKVDAPSGTALMLADAVASALPYEAEYVYDRHSVRQRRGKQEIGLSAVRGGTIVGDHEVIFAGPDEVIELRHSAQSRSVFANGAIAAAVYMAKVKEPGIYDMNHVLAEVLDK